MKSKRNTPGLEAPERREGERSEPARSGGASSSEGAPRVLPPATVPDSEVVAKPARRRFTADYKRSIVEQADACQDAGAVGALLRREGLYSSHLSTWRRQARQGELAGLTPKKRGRKTTVSPLVEENRKLLAINARLTKRLENAELIVRAVEKRRHFRRTTPAPGSQPESPCWRGRGRNSTPVSKLCCHLSSLRPTISMALGCSSWM